MIEDPAAGGRQPPPRGSAGSRPSCRVQAEQGPAGAGAAAEVADELDALAEPQRILDPRGRPDLAAA